MDTNANTDLARVLVEQTPDALIVVSGDGRICFWNRTAESLFEYSRADAEGRLLNEIFIFPGAPEEMQRLLRAAATHTVTLESTCPKKDGEFVNADITLRAISSGGPGLIAVSIKDVTAIKVLRHAKSIATRFQGLLESTPDAIVMVNKTGRIIMVNGQTEKLFGYGREEILGQPVEILLPERFRGRHVRYRTDYFKDPRTRAMGAGFELFGLRKDQTEFDIEISLSPLETEEGVVAVSSIRDITDRKKSEAKFKGLLESSPDAMVIANAAGTIVLVNNQLEKMFGYTREELMGKPIEILVPHRLRQQHPEYRMRYFADPRPRPMGSGMELSGQRKDGSEIPVEISLSPMDTEQGMLVMAAVRDITERKLAEAALRRKNEELAEQNRRVMEVNRLKSEFLANMSHELRTPLNAVIGFAELMHDGKTGPVSETHKEYLGDILTSARHLLQLINDVLDLAKVESGKMEFHPESVALSKIIGEVRDVLRSMAAKKRIDIETDIHPDLIRVSLDPSKLKQVLYNYLSNALKFTPDEGTIRIRVRPENEDYFRIDVEDSGIGIKPEDLHRLFVEFQQLDSSAAKKFQGTGLGLALTRRIVEAQGGSVGVNSEPGKGSVFFAILPRKSARSSGEQRQDGG